MRKMSNVKIFLELNYRLHDSPKSYLAENKIKAEDAELIKKLYPEEIGFGIQENPPSLMKVLEERKPSILDGVNYSTFAGLEQEAFFKAGFLITIATNIPANVIANAITEWLLPAINYSWRIFVNDRREPVYEGDFIEFRAEGLEIDLKKGQLVADKIEFIIKEQKKMDSNK